MAEGMGCASGKDEAQGTDERCEEVKCRMIDV